MKQRFGVRFTLPENDPMRLPHLLGESWESYRWYKTEEERDTAFAELNRQFAYYRRGDFPSQILTKIDA